MQTKYDYNVEGNGFFRLFPTGSNRYPAGAEAFNSYGRRPNANLLTDFGFVLLQNEWDSMKVMYKLLVDSPGVVCFGIEMKKPISLSNFE